MRSLVTEFAVPCGDCPAAQKKCFGFVFVAAEALTLTTSATVAASVTIRHTNGRALPIGSLPPLLFSQEGWIAALPGFQTH